jgi:cytochrome c oxidase subunit 3
MHDMPNHWLVLGLGIAGLIATFFSWFSNVVKEAQAGDHTPVVQLHLRYGMILFIASEVMFFVGWFWSWFDFALFPNALTDVVGGQFPPKAIEAVMDPFALPLLNTLILLCSGTTVTWAHHCLIHGDRHGLKTGLWLTILLGITFTSIQAYEYYHAPFGFGGNTYGSAFYMATGSTASTVLVGTIFLIVCLRRAYIGHFTPRPALRVRGGGVVLALRRRRLAVPVRRRLRLGRLGRAVPLSASDGRRA